MKENNHNKQTNKATTTTTKLWMNKNNVEMRFWPNSWNLHLFLCRLCFTSSYQEQSPSVSVVNSLWKNNKQTTTPITATTQNPKSKAARQTKLQQQRMLWQSQNSAITYRCWTTGIYFLNLIVLLPRGTQRYLLQQPTPATLETCTLSWLTNTRCFEYGAVIQREHFLFFFFAY